MREGSSGYLGYNWARRVDLKPQVSVVIPAYEENEQILGVLSRIRDSIEIPFECLIVTDSPDDSTNKFVTQMSKVDKRFKSVINDSGKGPAKAIRKGIEHAQSPVIVVTMADGSDDPRDITSMVRLVNRGVAVVAASRYMPGGQQIGAPFLKSKLSKLAGKTLYMFARVGTRDATNSFKAYSRDFLDSIEIESQFGFEMGLELVAKAKRRKLPIAEIPTIWLERLFGDSKFRLTQWIPRYLRWYFHAFGKERRYG